MLIVLAVLFVLLVGCIAAISGGGNGEPTAGEPSSEAPAEEPAPAPAEPAPPAEETAPAEPAPSTEQPPPSPEAPALTFPGITDDTTVVNVGETANVDNVDVTMSPLVDQEGSFGGPYLCSTATLVNNDDDSLSFTPFTFSLQNPQGAAISSTFGGSTEGEELQSGDLAPGGTVTGEVCWDGPAQPGQNVILYEPFDFTTQRGAWIQTF